jgi:hypothetical protein
MKQKIKIILIILLILSYTVVIYLIGYIKGIDKCTDEFIFDTTEPIILTSLNSIGTADLLRV